MLSVMCQPRASTFPPRKTHNTSLTNQQQKHQKHPTKVRDLRRLLEMYQRWQTRLFNAYDFNKFEAALEKLSGTNALKVCCCGVCLCSVC